MKGVILAGGSGTRLSPLTRITNKHLLPLYDRPMVTFAVEALVKAGIDELMVVTGGTHAGEFFRLLGNGEEHGIDRLAYAYQERAGGIAEALGLAERFVDGDKCCVLLADNVFERTLRPVAENFGVAITATLIFVVAIGAVVAAVTGYMAGLVGTSNSPVSSSSFWRIGVVSFQL